MDTMKINTAIETLAGKISEKTTPDEALKFTQAALNLVHILATLDNMKTPA